MNLPDTSGLMANLHLDRFQANWTTFVFLFFMVILFFYFGMRLGKIASTIISVYVSLAIVNSISYFGPDGPFFGMGGLFAVKLASFLLIIVIALIIVSRIAVKSILDVDKPGRIGERFLFAILAAGMLTTAMVSFLPEIAIEKFSSLANALFASDIAMFLWLVLPIFAMMMVKEDKDKEED